MSKSMLGSLKSDLRKGDMSEKLKLARFNNQETEGAEPQSPGSEAKTDSETMNAEPAVVSVGTTQKVEEKNTAEQKGKKIRPKNQVEQAKDFDWNKLEYFTEGVPEVDYGKASQRLTDENKEAFDEMAKRLRIPAVHLINHVLKSFRTQFREPFEKKYPGRTF